MTDAFDPKTLPETYYRVSAKALILDARDRLLVFKNDEGTYAIPGGGWEHAETFEACVVRELAEEAHATVVGVGPVKFCYQATTLKGTPKLCVAARVTLDSWHLIPDGNELIEIAFVTREEFLRFPFEPGEEMIQDYASQIWPDPKEPEDS